MTKTKKCPVCGREIKIIYALCSTCEADSGYDEKESRKEKLRHNTFNKQKVGKKNHIKKEYY